MKRRTPKFRVYDTLLKKIINDNIFLGFENPEYIFMQYTDLKDINDVEVCEGDIVIYKKEMEHDDTFILMRTGIVEYESRLMAFGFRYNNKMREYVGLDIIRDIEIIGNIYDNPELVSEFKNQ